MVNTVKYLKGERKGKLTLLALKDGLTSGGNKKRVATVQCDCGEIFDKQAQAFLYTKNPDLQMCDTCREDYYESQRISPTRHPLFETWRTMNRRCHDPAHQKYKLYGARGISVCNEWRGADFGDGRTNADGFEAFVSAMGEKPEGTTIDRIDNDKGYSPENCRWADAATQNANRRASATVSDEKFVVNIVAAHMEVGIDSDTLREKLEQLLPKLTSYLLGG